MSAIDPRDRTLVDETLAEGESLIALMRVEKGKVGPTTTVGTVGSTGGGLVRYMDEHGIVDRGVGGVYDLADVWLALTDRRLAFFRGTWFTLRRPRPKKHILDMPVDSFSLRWRLEPTGVRPHVLVHLAFPADEHLVAMADQDAATEAFIAAVGDAAQELPPAG